VEVLNRNLLVQSDEYKLENDRLKAKLEAALQPKSLPADMDSSTQGLSDDTSLSASPTLAEEYHHLAKKYAQDMQTHERVNAMLVEKNRMLKENAKSWKSWGEQRKAMHDQRGVKIRNLQARIEQLKSEGAGNPNNEFVPSHPSTPRSSSVDKPPPSELLSSAVTSAPVGGTTEDVLPPLPLIFNSPDLPKDTGAAIERNLDSSQTTAGYDTEHASSPPKETGHHFPSQNEQTIHITGTSIKRKRRAPGSIISALQTCIDKEGSPEKPIRIKSERYSSSLGSPMKHDLPRTESLDLDEIGDRIDTPRKRRKHELLRQASSFQNGSIHESRHERSSSVPLEHQLSTRRCDDKNLELTVTPELEQEGNDASHSFDSKAMSESSYSFTIKNELDEEPTPSRTKSRALKALSTNQRMLPRTSNPTASKERTRDLERGARAIHVLAEDGNHLPKPSRSMSPASRERADLRLGALLEQQTPAKSPLFLEPRSSKAAVKNALSHLETPVASKHNKVKDTPMSALLPTPTSLPPTTTMPVFKMPPPPPTPKHTTPRIKPLRERPVTALRLDDFKINPKAYRGLDMTAEPVRGREARRHQMDGCKDPTCSRCGDQLKILSANLPVTVGSTLFASTQDDELTEDEKLIKYYLGARFNLDKVARMDSQERDDLIMKAKQQIISERHIRHRVKPNQRRQSPPGYWDVEFPVTQEVEARREEADRRERAEVEERYREAMRPGGKWVFKDE
jgi:hypothetical protein